MRMDKFPLASSQAGQTPAKGALLIFYRGHWCFCNSELRSLQETLPEFDRRRIPRPPDSKTLARSRASLENPRAWNCEAFGLIRSSRKAPRLFCCSGFRESGDNTAFRGCRTPTQD